MSTKNKYSLEQIKSMTQHKSGFSTPENYFESVENSVLRYRLGDRPLRWQWLELL